MAMAVSMDGVSADASTSTSSSSNIFCYKTMMIAILLMLLCGAIAVCFYLRFALGVAKGENFAQKMNKTLHQILDELEYRMGWGIYETKPETLQEKRRRYFDSEMCEVSDGEYWRHVHYGPPWTDQHNEREKSEFSLSNDTMLRCSNPSPELWQTMLETNALLRSRVERLECEWDEAQLRNDAILMAQIEGQIRETHGMIYTGLDKT